MAQAERETVDRIPPQNLDAEMSVLGSILLSNEATATAVHVIKPQDFYSPAHQLLFGLMVELYDQNRPIDPLILKEELNRRDLLQKAGGTEYLVRLMDVVPSAANVEHYAEIVREKAVLRGLIEAGTEVVRAAHSGAYTYRQLADLAESRILAVSREAETGEAATLRDLLHQTFDRLDVFQGREGRLTGLETGFPDLDDLTSGLQPGELVVVAGRPSMGKTSFALNVAEHVGSQLHKHVVLFSLEMSKQQVAQNMLCSHAEVDAMKLRKGMVSHSEVQLLVNTASILSDAPILIDDTSALTALELRAKARRLHRRQPLALIVVDYLQLLEYASWPKAENRQQEITQISRSLKSLARELHVPVIAISQLNRAADTREDHRPRMADLRECVTGDTLVCLADGRRVPIRDLVGQTPRVWSISEGRLEARPCEAVWKVGSRSVFDVRLASGRSLRATALHRIHGASGWVRVQDLRAGDRAAIARRLPESGGAITWNERRRRMCAVRGTSPGGTSQFPLAPSRSLVAEHGELLEDESLRQAATSDLFWDRVVRVESAGNEEVYDLTVPGTECWLADGLVSHNSGAIEQDADLILFLFREEYYKESEENRGRAEVLIAKQRNGPTGSVQLHFAASHMRFRPLTSRVEPF